MALQRPETLTAAVAAHIQDRIVRGELAPGSRLAEIALAQELSTSRATVREALRTMADGGLVQVIPHRGVFVSPMSVRVAWEITSVRSLLEPYAARLALEASASDDVLQREVRAAFEELRAAIRTRDPIKVADADANFHRVVSARCGHEMLISQLETLRPLFRRIVLTNQMVSADAPTLIAQHAPIVEAVELRDPQLIETAVRNHVIEAGELLMTRMAALDHGVAEDGGYNPFRLGRWPTGPYPRVRPPGTKGAQGKQAAGRPAGGHR